MVEQHLDYFISVLIVWNNWNNKHFRLLFYRMHNVLSPHLRNENERNLKEHSSAMVLWLVVEIVNAVRPAYFENIIIMIRPKKSFIGLTGPTLKIPPNVAIFIKKTFAWPPDPKKLLRPSLFYYYFHNFCFFFCYFNANSTLFSFQKIPPHLPFF